MYNGAGCVVRYVLRRVQMKCLAFLGQRLFRGALVGERDEREGTLHARRRESTLRRRPW